MRVLVCSPTPFHFERVVRALKLENIKVVIVCLPFFGLSPIKTGVSERKLSWISLPFYILFRLSLFFSARQVFLTKIFHILFSLTVFLASRKGDIVICASGFSYFFTRFSSVKQVRLIVEHGSLSEKLVGKLMVSERAEFGFNVHGPWGNKWLVNQQFREYIACDAINVLSDLSKRTLVEDGVPATKINVFRPPTGFFKDNAPALNSTETFPHNSILTVVYVGAVIPSKGLHYLLLALERINLPIELRVCGRIGADVSLQKFLRRHGSRVSFLGHLSKGDLRDELLRADCIVHPSIADGFAMAVAEALSFGVFALVSSNTGARELLVDSLFGRVFEAQSTQALAEVLLWAYENRDKIRSDRDHRRSEIMNVLQEDSFRENWNKLILRNKS